MSYLVLARKWRPRSFDTLIGQDHVVRALTHALSSGRLHHAWLFTGTRGVGKTTLSRILAKSLNCAEGVTATPCGHCQACTEIDAGRYVDYIELDAASNRGVDEMTQLLEQAVYAPSVGRYKVYMIDEVHMLTGHAFNAMLKTLEEPPEHVKFILATTDPQKIPVTVLSRCLQFNLKQMTVPAIVEHLRHVLSEESIPAETQGLRLIAQAAAGSMRDALSLTDQAISYSAGDLTAAAVGEMLGTLDQHHLVHLLQALTAGDAAAVVAVADDLALRGLSFQSALADLAVMLSRVAIAQRLGHAQPDDPLAPDIEALAGALAPDETQLFYTVAVHSRRELSLAPDEYAGFVMACLRMLALLPADRVPPVIAEPSPSVAAEAPVASVATSDAMPGLETEPARDVGAPGGPDVNGAPSVSLAVPDAAEDAGDWTQDVPEPTEDFDSSVSLAADDVDPVLSTLPPVSQRADIEIPDPARMTAADWPALAASLPVGGAARALAVNSEWLAGDERQIRLRVAIHSLVESSSQDRLRTMLSEHFGRVLRLDVEYGDTGEDTAYAVDQAERGRRQQAAEEAVAQDPLVQALVREFAARVVPGSVQPPGHML
ncbi:MAG: DNA polymerase III subunit gamma/tau [Castellaniella sp.]|uniref:DNA polymerase III subunit gamma/tau n=1 Tax=Castellaniella sp. TaxID=1955812 RepID=UPI0012054D68|nr:DNA polymerase III subunit gamma/tau [Castellaniella sp.]TAN31074.1 MAG: DNA polymerase III subunit gamma/tau [Castellaniella sp.]